MATLTWKKYELTDGTEIFAESSMSEEGLEQAQEQARIATDGNLFWRLKVV